MKFESVSGLYSNFLRYYHAAKIFRFFRHHLYIYPTIFSDLLGKKLHLSSYHKPRNIVLKLHSACNAKCSFCYAQKDYRSSQKMLYLDAWKNVIDQAKELGCYSVTLSGGEPLIYKGLVDLVEYIRSKKMIPFTTTNGLSSHYDLFRQLDKAGLCALNFSIHGPPEHHDSIMGVPGAFEKLIEAGRFCAANTKIICIVNHVFTKSSARNGWYQWVWDKMEPLGFRALNLLPICISCPDTSDLLGPEDLKLFDELAKKPYIIMDTKNYSKPICPAAREDLFVNNFGMVQPCPFIPISFGNVREESLKDIFLRMQNHKMFAELRSVCMPARDENFISEYILPAFKRGNLPAPIEWIESDNEISSSDL